MTHKILTDTKVQKLSTIHYSIQFLDDVSNFKRVHQQNIDR